MELDLRIRYNSAVMGTLAELNDEAVTAAVEGSREAIDRVVAAMNDQVRLMVYARLNPSPAQRGYVEELTQQSIEALLQGLSGLKVRTLAGLRAFASTIVARRVADHIRNPAGVGRGRAAPASLDSTMNYASVAGPLWQFLSAGGTSPVSAAAREDQFQRTMSELTHLREEYRAAITMAFFDQLSTAQIAERMGTTRQASSMLLLRAVKALRKRLTGASRIDVERPSGF